VPLLLLDLDNTLVDRDAAFHDTVAAFLAEHGLPETDVGWLMSVDASGYTPRETVAQAMLDRYGAVVGDGVTIRRLLEHGARDRVVLPDATRDALGKGVADGWRCAIVTNGGSAQQEAKIRNAGLDGLVHGWVISEAVGHRKPEPEIFRLAADAAGAPLDGGWVIGDSPQADIAGAHGLGLRSVWVSGGRPWPRDIPFRPTHVAEDAASAIRYVVSEAR
jgi:putative hydrolase of the HAD superfamily